MKGGFYAVFGTNAAGIFTDWDKVLAAKSDFIGFKNKKFGNKSLAIDFIVNGMSKVYGVLDVTHFNKDILLNNLNSVIDIDDLTINQALPWSIKLQ